MRYSIVERRLHGGIGLYLRRSGDLRAALSSLIVPRKCLGLFDQHYEGLSEHDTHV
jgi:hypothetical protein